MYYFGNQRKGTLTTQKDFNVRSVVTIELITKNALSFFALLMDFVVNYFMLEQLQIFLSLHPSSQRSNYLCINARQGRQLLIAGGQDFLN